MQFAAVLFLGVEETVLGRLASGVAGSVAGNAGPLVAPAGHAVGANIRLRLDAATTPGRYQGEIHLGGLDGVAKHVVARGLTAGVGGSPQDDILGGGQAQAQPFGLRYHCCSVHHLTYKND